MATMAPALTEAATQARAKLSNKEGSQSETPLVNGRAKTPTSSEGTTSSTPTGQAGPSSKTSQLVTIPKELLTAGIIDKDKVNLSGLQQIDLELLKGLPSGLRKSSVLSSQPKNGMSQAQPGTSTSMNYTNAEATTSMKQPAAPSSTQSMVPNSVGVVSHSGVIGPTQRPSSTTVTATTNSLPNLSNQTGSQLNLSNNVNMVSQGNSTSTQSIPSTSSTPSTSQTVSVPPAAAVPSAGPATTRPVATVARNVNVRATATPNVQNDPKIRQRLLERKADRLLRRLRRLQSRQAVSHIRQQLSGFVDHQHKNLQTMAKSMKSPSPSTSVDLKTELLQSEDVKSLSTAALVNLVRKLQSSQALSLRQRLAHQQAANEGGSSVLRLDEDLCTEMSRVAGTLGMNLHHLESAVDSDATESSSGGESCDEDFGYDEKPPRSTL